MSTITITARDLRDLVTPVLPFTSSDQMLPVLNAVQFRVVGSTLIATATDRFRLAFCKHQFDGEADGTFSATVRDSDLRQILALFKATRYDNPTLRLTVEGVALTVTTEGALAGMVAASLTFALETGKYPDVHKLFTDAAATEPAVTALGFNAAFLADFRHAVRHGESMQIRTGKDERSPVLVTIGDYFAGLIMPKLIGDKVNQIPAWTALLTPPEPKKAQSGKGAAA